VCGNDPASIQYNAVPSKTGHRLSRSLNVEVGMTCQRFIIDPSGFGRVINVIIDLSMLLLTIDAVAWLAYTVSLLL